MSARSSFLNAEWTLNFDCYCNGGYLTLSLPLFNGQFWLDGIVSLSLSRSKFLFDFFFFTLSVSIETRQCDANSPAHTKRGRYRPIYRRRLRWRPFLRGYRKWANDDTFVGGSITHTHTHTLSNKNKHSHTTQKERRVKHTKTNDAIDDHHHHHHHNHFVHFQIAERMPATQHTTTTETTLDDISHRNQLIQRLDTKKCLGELCAPNFFFSNITQ